MEKSEKTGFAEMLHFIKICTFKKIIYIKNLSSHYERSPPIFSLVYNI